MHSMSFSVSEICASVVSFAGAKTISQSAPFSWSCRAILSAKPVRSVSNA